VSDANRTPDGARLLPVDTTTLVAVTIRGCGYLAAHQRAEVRRVASLSRRPITQPRADVDLRARPTRVAILFDLAHSIRSEIASVRRTLPDFQFGTTKGGLRAEVEAAVRDCAPRGRLYQPPETRFQGGWTSGLRDGRDDHAIQMELANPLLTRERSLDL